MKHLASRAAAAALLVAALGITGCPFMPGKDDPVPPPPDFLPRTSAANLLNNLQKAYEKRASAEYESLLAKDFTFYLSNEDQQDPDMPDSWNQPTEVQIQTRMFDTEYVQTLTLSFDQSPASWDPANQMYVARISKVRLFLDGSTPDHPEIVKQYTVDNGTAKFYFRKNPWFAPGTTDSVWTIVQWWDNPID